jgi:uncharacterized protein (DUF488 family)
VSVTGIGYEGLTLETFVSRLRLHSVDVLVDVRLNAISRKRGFSKKSLAAALEESGIEYQHLPTLGNERDNRGGYAEVGSEFGNHARARFRDSLEDAPALESLREIANLSLTKKVVVFCFEEDEAHCHREQVIEAVNALPQLELVNS